MGNEKSSQKLDQNEENEVIHKAKRSYRMEDFLEVKPHKRPVLPNSLRTRVEFRLLALLGFDSAQISLLPLQEDVQIDLRVLLDKIKPVLIGELIPSLFPLLKNENDMEKLWPLLRIYPSGSPDLVQSFRLILEHATFDIQPFSALSLACELNQRDIALKFFISEASAQLEKELKWDPFLKFMFFHWGWILESDKTFENALETLLKEPICSKNGVLVLCKHAMATNPEDFYSILLGDWVTHLPGLLDGIKMNSAVFLPTAEAICDCVPLEKLYDWGIRTKASFNHHLTLWLEIWSFFRSSQQTKALLNRCLNDPYLGLGLITEQLGEIVCKPKHLCFLSDFLNELPEDQQNAQVMAILAKSLSNGNQTLLSHFFNWAPKSTWKQVWEKLLVDFVVWTTHEEFSAYCVLLENSQGSLGHLLGQQMIEEILFSHHLPEPRFDQLNMLYSYCGQSNRLKFIRFCLEACLTQSWSADAFKWIWRRLPNLEKKLLSATCFQTKQSHMSKTWERCSIVLWKAEYREVILSDKFPKWHWELFPSELFSLLKTGQPRMFLLVWEALLKPQERETMRSLFEEMSLEEWLELLALESGMPFCLQIVREKLLQGKPTLEKRFWAFLMKNDIISDYAAAPCYLGAIIDSMDQALSPELKLEFCVQTYIRHCPAAPVDTYDPCQIIRYQRALLATTLLDRQDVAQFVERNSKSHWTIKNNQWRPLVKLLAQVRMDNVLDLLLKKDRKKLLKILKEQKNDLLMEWVCHNFPKQIPASLPLEIQRKQLELRDFWRGFLRLNSEFCVHHLSPSSPMTPTGRRQDPRWLQIIFEDFASDSKKIVSVRSMEEYACLCSRIDALTNKLKSLHLLINPENYVEFD